jgi:hypothetical protein
MKTGLINGYYMVQDRKLSPILHFLFPHFILHFRALVGVIDEYFEGYYTEEMIESQVWLLSGDSIIHVLYGCEHLYNIATPSTG